MSGRVRGEKPINTFSGQFLQKTICWFNVFAVFCSLVLMTIGLFIACDRNFLRDLLGTEAYSSATYLLIILGFGLFVFSVIGCCGARRENRCLVTLYAVGLLILLILLLIAAIIAIVFRSTMGVAMKDGMRRTLIQYYGSQSQIVTDAWDIAQWRLECCAVDNEGWSTYNASKWIREVNTGLQPIMPGYKYVPQSCCVTLPWTMYYKLVDVHTCTTTRLGPPGTPIGAHNDYIYYRGCYDAGYDFLATHAAVILGLGIFVGISLLIGVILSCCLRRHLDDI